VVPYRVDHLNISGSIEEFMQKRVELNRKVVELLWKNREELGFYSAIQFCSRIF